jgi:hypothetical protein
MITVESKTDFTQVWTNPSDGGVYTFVRLSTLSPGDQLAIDRIRPGVVVLTPPLLASLATAGPDPTKIFVRVRDASPADRAKPNLP